jgi:hypothetical protein
LISWGNGNPLGDATIGKRHAEAVVDLDIVGVLSIAIFMHSGHRSIANLRVAIADIVSRS